jgi:hypothetical protein
MVQHNLSGDAPKPGSKQWKSYKASVCEKALALKKQMDRSAERYGEVTSVLAAIFEADDSEYFSNNGNVKLTKSKSYSIPEENIEKVEALLTDRELVIDDYVNQKTSWGVTAKMRSLIERDSDIAELIIIKSSQSVTVKASK